METKKCNKCGQVKPVTEYHKDKNGRYGVKGKCKKCIAEIDKKRSERLNHSPIDAKKCKECGQVKPETEYDKNKRNKDGLSSWCKVCRKKKKKEQLKKKEYISVDAKECKKCGRVKPADNFSANLTYKDGKRAICKECDAAESKEYAKNNPDKIRAIQHKRRAKKKGNGGSYTVEEWAKCLEFFNYRDAYTGASLVDPSADHVVAISKGGTNFICNIVPCNRNINSSKGVKEWIEWYRSQTYYSEKRERRILLWIETNTQISFL